MFADDATFAMDGPYNSFQKLKRIFAVFKLKLGLKLNINKTKILRLGLLKYTDVQRLENLKFLCTSNSAKTSGIFFSNNKQMLIKNNL